MIAIVTCRVLVDQVCLSPWAKSLAPKPRSRVPKVVCNFRIIATLMYCISTKINPSLPPIPQIRVIDRQPSGAVAPENVPLISSKVMVDFERTHADKGWLHYLISKILPDETTEKGADVKRSNNFTAVLGPTVIELAPEVAVEQELLQLREWFAPLSTLHKYLLPSGELNHIWSADCTWIQELVTDLNAWLDTVVADIVARKLKHNLNKAEAVR
jgi:hypothetical protein